MKGRVLIIAGSDSGGGAGIQADLKAVTALGAFGMTAITALTAQNTLGVHGVLPVPLEFLRQQIAVVMDDLGADAIKTGMLADSATIEAVCDEITARAPGVPLVAATVALVVNDPPRNGFVTISPASGVAMTTEFDIEAGGWVDDVQVSQPLCRRRLRCCCS